MLDTNKNQTFMKNIISKIVTSLLFTLLITNVCHSQYSSKQVDSIMSYAMDTFNVAGVAVAIVKDGKTIHSKGYGVTSFVTKRPVNEHTNFAIASNKSLLFSFMLLSI